jgi:hypothetical protein
MIIITTATNLDWVWTEINVRDDQANLLLSAVDTPEQYDLFQQGVNEGWITIIGPVQ